MFCKSFATCLSWSSFKNSAKCFSRYFLLIVVLDQCLQILLIIVPCIFCKTRSYFKLLFWITFLQILQIVFRGHSISKMSFMIISFSFKICKLMFRTFFSLQKLQIVVPDLLLTTCKLLFRIFPLQILVLDQILQTAVPDSLSGKICKLLFIAEKSPLKTKKIER